VDLTFTHTHEVLVIRKGSLVVTLYDNDSLPFQELQLTQGDAILLAHGGHGITMLTECEILEIKQGPYAGLQDKTALESSKDDSGK
jgi:uncharacterized protein YjlB